MDPVIVGGGLGLLMVSILFYVMWRAFWRTMVDRNREINTAFDRLDRHFHEEDEW